MESTQELQHWGIKGQKWGIRRYQNPDGTLTEAGKKRYYYQNPDGSLTEAGKKDYMTAAKKGKLDVSKLSDNDLNMINSRFAREKTFKQNVSDYEKSTFKYKLKEAALERIKGSGGGKGKGKGGGGGSSIGKLLAAPIAKAFADAFKPSNGGKGNSKDDDEEENRLADWKKYKEYKNNGHVWTAGFKWSKADKQNRERWENEGKRFCDNASKNWTMEPELYGKQRTSGSRTSDQYLLDNYRSTHKKTKAEPSVASKKWKKWDKIAERAGKSGLIISHSSARYAITRSSDELYHHGIKGQRWGVRRYQNDDGTWTEEGKKRYGTPDRHTEKLMKRVTKIGNLGYRDKLSAVNKLSKDKNFRKMIDDDDLKAKRAEYKTAHDKWFELSKGEDFDAYDDETGYENYGITPKEFRKIMKLDAKRVAAQDKLFNATKKKVEAFTNNYTSQPLSKIKLSDEEQKKINRILISAALKG